MFTFLALLCLSGSALAGIPSFPYDGPADGISSKIILGGDAPDGQHPYIVSLNTQSNNGHYCGASVLTANAVLTAAHCCAGTPLYVYAGSQKLSSGGQRYDISDYIVHEKYTGGDNYYQNDLCVIKLKTPLKLGATIAQVKFPTPNMTVNEGDLVTIVGWGYVDPNAPTVPDKLQIGRNYIALSNSRCNQEAGVPAFGGEICARGAGEGQGVCNGDSGSPLTLNGVQVGVASFIFTPCGSPYPDFYARVPYYTDWIQKQLGADAMNLQFIKQ